MEDEKIIDLFWQRQEEAISRTSEKYGKYCRSIAFNILRNTEDSRECENDTYMAVWNTIPPTKPNSFFAFIGRITRNLAFNKYDYNRAQKRDAGMNLILEELEECVPVLGSVKESFEAKETAELINAFLHQMDETGRVVFVRRYWYSDSVSDIGKRMGMNESKVKSMLFRMRNKLKTHLEKGGVVL